MSDFDIKELPASHVRSALTDGWIAEWLVAGPLLTPITDATAWRGPDRRGQILAAYAQAESQVSQTPSERAVFEPERADGAPAELRWQIANTAEDGLISTAGTVATLHHGVVWRYAQLILPQPRSIRFALTTSSPLTVWINGQPVLQSERFFDEQPGQLEIHLPLGPGTNELLIRQETVAQGDYALALGVRLDPDGEVQVALPTTLEPIERRQKLVDVMGQAYVLADVYRGKDKITLHWPKSMQRVDALTIRLQRPDGRIYAETAQIAQPGHRVTFGVAEQYASGVYDLLLMPQPEEYYVQEMRVERRIPFRVVNENYSSLYQGIAFTRRGDTLRDAAKRQGLWAEVARAKLGEPVREAVVEQAIRHVALRGVQCGRHLLGLLTLAALHGQQACLSPELAQTIEATVAAVVQAREAEDESPLLAWGNRLLAASLYPGVADATVASAELVPLLNEIGVRGLRAWLASDAMTDAMAMLAGLVQFSADDDVGELAAATLDRLSLDLAIHSFQGVPGGSRSHASTASLQCGITDPLSGVCRLLWGMGALGREPSAEVALALAEAYEVPEIIAAIAVNRDAEALTRACHAPGSAWQADQVVYRTPDYLLSSVTDYRAGQRGAGEVTWQAVMGPDAQVHVNYPANASPSDAMANSYWRGDARLPRVAQWRNCVVAVYGAVDDGALGFTHAYFPTAAFDEVQSQDGWLFGRKGAAYIALGAAGGVTLREDGPTARREARVSLRAGEGAIWVCRMGRAALDGTFADFVAAVLAATPRFELGAQPSVQWQTPEGEDLRFGWSQPLSVDGVEMPLRDYPLLSGSYAHVDAGAAQIEVRYSDAVMMLDFGAPAAAMPDDDE